MYGLMGNSHLHWCSGVKNIDTHDSLKGFNVTIKDEQAPAEPEAPEAPIAKRDQFRWR